MGQYLDRFKSQVGQKQTEQILKLLNEQRNSGQIRTVEEFSKKLESLIRDLTSTTIQPISKMYEAEANKEINSESYNYMLDRAQNDLETAFTEAQNISEVQSNHETIIRDVALKNLKAGIAELEARISLYEFLNKDLRGFNNALFTTFRESKENRTFRGTNTFTAILFKDQKVGDITDQDEDASVELVGEKLTLAVESSTNYPIRNISQLFDDDTEQSELIVDPPNLSLSNLIDGTKETYWVQSLLYTTPREYVKVKLDLDLGIVREIDHLEIEPATRLPLVLESISYLDHNNVVNVLNIDEQEFVSPIALEFQKISTSRIILTFRNEHPTFSTFQYDPVGNTLTNQSLQQQPGLTTPDLSVLNPILDTLLPSPRVKELLGITSNEVFTFDGYEFQTGFDNIRLGLSEYNSRSIYVSSPLKLAGAGQIGLKVIEKRPYTPVPTGDVLYTAETYDYLDNNESGGTNSRNFLGSIEYWIAKQDFTSTGSLFRTNVFPILPLNTERVHHERLVLNEQTNEDLYTKDTGTLNFFTTSTDGDIKVYRNFQLLSLVVDDLSDGWQVIDDVSLRTPNQKTRMRFKIRINQPLATDIYTVTYTPVVSSTRSLPSTIEEFAAIGGSQVVDLSGDLSIRSLSGQVISLDHIGEDQSNLDSEIYLIIILRQNTANAALSPAVEEYTLLTGYKDPTKLV